jgi:putative membrane protein
MQFLISFIVNAIVLWLVICFVPGYNNHGATGTSAYSVWTIVVLAVIFGVVNALIGPILRLISAPLTWITHGLFSVIINWILLALAVYFAPGVQASFWWSNLVGAIVLMLVGTGVTMMTSSNNQQAAS